MTADPASRNGVRRIFVVAMEYRGDDVPEHGTGEVRVAICEHAYDIPSATLAGEHLDPWLRIAFPVQPRGWNTPAEIARCAVCDAAVAAIVRDLIAAAFNRLR